MLRGRLLRCGIWATALIMACSAAARAADLVIAMPNWSSGQATANILKVGMKKKFGLDADVVEMGTHDRHSPGSIPARSTSIRKSGSPISIRWSRRTSTEAKTVRLSPKGVSAPAGYLRQPRDGGQIRHQGHFGSRRSEKDGRLRHRWRRQGRDVDWRANWSSTSIETHPRQSYGYAKNHDAARNAGRYGDGGGRCGRGHRAGRWSLPATAPHVVSSCTTLSG